MLVKSDLLPLAGIYIPSCWRILWSFAALTPGQKRRNKKDLNIFLSGVGLLGTIFGGVRYVPVGAEGGQMALGPVKLTCWRSKL